MNNAAQLGRGHLQPGFFLNRFYRGLTRTALAERDVDGRATAEAALADLDECVRLNPGMKGAVERARAQCRRVLDK